LDACPDGDSDFFGLSPTLSFSLTDKIGGYVFGWWQQQRYQTARNNLDADGNTLSFGQRTNNKYEAGAGLSWELVPS
jgi:hypothetical protein